MTATLGNQPLRNMPQPRPARSPNSASGPDGWQPVVYSFRSARHPIQKRRMPLQAGSTLGPYVVEAQLGAGGMGEVYRARDTRLNRTVAIKVLSAQLTETPLFHKRFEREARVIAAIEHPHICPLYDVGEEHGTTFLVMQHLHGETLADHLKGGPLPSIARFSLPWRSRGALDAAHRAGVVHRDLKPANIMVTKSGVKLLDFGLARLTKRTASVAGRLGRQHDCGRAHQRRDSDGDAAVHGAGADRRAAG